MASRIAYVSNDGCDGCYYPRTTVVACFDEIGIRQQLMFIPFAFFVFQRLPRAQAAATVVLTGSILLPERIAVDLPAIPPIDKEYLTYLSALIAAYVFRRDSILRARPGQGLEAIVILLLVANIRIDSKVIRLGSTVGRKESCSDIPSRVIPVE